MKELIEELFKKYGFELSERQIEQFDKYMKFLLEENAKFNLTAIEEPEEIVIKHFIDSILGIDKIEKGASLVDVGSGAGFPGVPIKIMREDIELTLIDSLSKRVNFLKELSLLLGLENVKCKHVRAEDFAMKEGREKFDVATARAVAALPTLAEYLLPLVKVGGKVIMFKGLKSKEELAQGDKAIRTLGGKLESVLSFKLDDFGERNVIVLKKVSKTDAKYPRGKNQPKLKPIL